MRRPPLCRPVRRGPAGTALRSRPAARRLTAAAAALAAAALLAPAAGDAATSGPGAGGAAGGRHVSVAKLEAEATRLARQYRGVLETLAGAEADAKSAAAHARAVRRQLAVSRRQIARLAAASYLSGAADQALAALFSGRPNQVLSKSAILGYLAGERAARQRALRRLMAASQAADQAAIAQAGRLRRMIAALQAQRQTVSKLLARFHPQSPVIGDNITPRMRRVKDAVDSRFGPFSAIGCYRPEATGEHPLGRACDFMLSTGGVMPTAANIRLGYAIARWAQANASRLGIMYIIYRQHIWDIRMASAGWVPMPDRGSITANHYDHVHISVF